MEPPPSQSIEVSGTGCQAGDDTQDKIINEWLSCCYDCTQGIFDFLCCNFC
ncbi:hypothetical protein AAZX31_01G171000 [Glycine max]|uniref:Uncharacterized protein n=2 Tax=Glycine subgen. Soja TaxID=1462606 RepID=A0A0R0LJP6_SOYBN|nr:hypothetical protein GYH30_001998 [Glycine max]KHN36208.1 hypothetical protein glysoja_003331 [Glycine soja]KRH76955.1 hypothetical protein GLYMA_01G184100v4 [Glycine max]RZC30614.1 hypothetical protein D0Y65_001935 [Glycine soja]